MTTQQKQLWRATGRNMGISVCLFAALIVLLWLSDLIFPDAHLLQWHDTAWCVGLPASIIGVAYVLTIRDPQNYTGFYAGITMSVLLAVQFFLLGQYDSTFLYLFMFIPFQILSIVNWKKTTKSDETFLPEFLPMKAMLLSLFVCIMITCTDYLLATYFFNKEALTDNIAIKIFNGLLISSSFFANFWLIYRKNDSWLYWILYSVAGIALFIIINNIFSIVLFTFFLVINSMAGFSWIKTTPRDRYGWLIGK